MPETDNENNDGTLEPTTETGAPHRVGGFRYHRHGDRWQWSDAVARPHVAHTLEVIRTAGGPFSSRHRILDTAGAIRSVIVVGDTTTDRTGQITGSTGFYIDVTDTVDHIAADITASRGAIEQAKGMLMIIYNIPADRAFDTLVWRSQQTNVKLRDLAAALLDRAHERFHLPHTLRTEFDHILLDT